MFVVIVVSSFSAFLLALYFSIWLLRENKTIIINAFGQILSCGDPFPQGLLGDVNMEAFFFFF